MQESTRILPYSFQAVLAAACLLAFAGCRAGQSPGDEHGHDDHAGHVVPTHKPKTFPVAVRRLRELTEQIGGNLVDAKPRSESDNATIHIALDIANWLPEIAADSEMPETPWNEVNARSTALVADFQQVLAGPSGNPRGAVEAASAEIASLERLLASSDPRWFSDNKKKPATSSPEPASDVNP
jgi:hypothetical protein